MSEPTQKRALVAALLFAAACLALIVGLLFGLRPDLPALDAPADPDLPSSPVASPLTRSATATVGSNFERASDDAFADTFVKGVVRSTDGALLSGVVVRLEDRRAKRSRETRSDAAGRYAFRGVFPGHYELRADAVGFMPTTRTFRRLRVPEDDQLDLELAPSGLLEGLVLGDGKPLAGARVFVRSREKDFAIETRSDAAGRFVADPVPLTGLVLAAWHQDYAGDWIRIDPQLPDGDLPAPHAQPVSQIALSRFATIELRPGVRVHGSVVSADGAPIAGARVGNMGRTSGPDGRFSLRARELPIHFQVTARGFVEKSVRAESSELNIVLEPGRRAWVRVLDAAGQAVAGARVTLACGGTGTKGETNNAGEVGLDGIPSGPCAATIEHIAHPKSVFDLGADKTEHTFSFAPAASLRGRVLSGGRPVSRYGYQLRGPVRLGGRVVSESGSLDLEPLEGGAYSLVLSGPGLLTETFHLEFQEGEHKSGARFELTAEARVRGRASREGDSVELTDTEARVHEWRNANPADADPTWGFEFDRLPAGHYTLRLRGREGQTVREQSLQLEAGQIAVIDLR